MKSVTKEQLKSLIVSEHYFTAAQGYARSVSDNWNNDPYPAASPDVLDRLTFCVLVLKNGFSVTGESCCADPAKYDQTIGEQLAYENAFDKLWLLEGYLLRQQMYKQEEVAK